jgi:hypothetical protein
MKEHLKRLVPPDGFYIREIKQIFCDLCSSPIRRVEIGQDPKWLVGMDKFRGGCYVTGYGETPESAFENAIANLSSKF